MERRTAGYGRPISTRKLIIAALLCGVAILVAGTILLFSLSSSDIRDRVNEVPAPTTTTKRS